MNGVKRGLQMIFDYFNWLEKNIDDPRALDPAKAWIQDIQAVKGAVRNSKLQDIFLFALISKDPFANSRAVFHEVTGK